MAKDKKSSIQVKTPKGTRDCFGDDMAIREKIFSTITNVFKLYGAARLDTPAFELREILAGKYGEDSKLIFDLADQGGEISSLRYDLTVPLARYLASNTSISTIKRYQIDKVWRRDQPAMTKGRLREFYQCDIDFAGQFGHMISDAEILSATRDVFERLGWEGKYTIKINNRKILDGIFQVCGVPTDKLRTISSAVDKLDKSPWEEVRREMTEEKGLDAAVADRIGTYVVRKGGRDLLDALKQDEALSVNESAKKGLEDMTLLFDYLENYEVLDRISLDMSLARGLDYYTGVIYEVITEGSAPPGGTSKKKASSDDDRSDDPTVGVGSVAAGGRYDNLVSMFSGKDMPCVGISFGVERIFSIMKMRTAKTPAPNPAIHVFVMAFGDGMIKERMRVTKTLRDAELKVDFSYKDKPKLPAQFKEAEQKGAPFAVILGGQELSEGKVKVKEMGLPEGDPEKDGVLVQMENMVQEVQKKLQAWRVKTGISQVNI
ncbi:histidyl-tRNA synthetase mitochondrial precursor [Viridothelium virens]|uniref:Histidine--tRNA ligase, mitochondrial n=1 Tax=Viridothelium virens TaxID=1048519 RepID=A0A6A6GZ50_VIRVR|nr:histidyl-tRNA synthetase mitochondrial precursor [Viridothelium virens]